MDITRTVLAATGFVHGKAIALYMDATLAHPDYAVYNRAFGEDVNIADCLAAKQQIPLWLRPISYNYRANSPGPWTLPADYTAGRVPWMLRICPS